MDVKTEDKRTTPVDGADDNHHRVKETKCLQIWNQPLYRRKLAHTGALCFAMFMYGWSVAIKGPSLLDLQEITHTDTTGGASFFTSAAVGSVLGALVGGAIYDRFNKQLIIFISVLLFAVTFALISFCASFWSMIILFFLNEFVVGCFKTGSNVEILNLWGDDSKKYMQGLHFCFSLGATISPLILQPFLSNDYSAVINRTINSRNLDDNYTSSRDLNLVYNTDSFNETSLEVSENQEDASQIQIPYIISGALIAVSAIGLFIRYFTDRNKPVTGETGIKESKHHSFYPRWAIIVTLFFFLFLYFFLDEVEDSSPTFLATFVIRGLGWSKSDGARVTSAFWAAFTVGRLIGTISISYLSHYQFFIICSCSLVLAQTGLLLSGLFHIHLGVWLSVVLTGVSIAVILPASLTWMEKEFVSVSGKIVSVIYIALSLGGMVNPQVIGYLIQHVNHMGYCYILLAETLMFVLTLVALKIFLEKVLKPYRPDPRTVEAEDGNCETPIHPCQWVNDANSGPML